MTIGKIIYFILFIPLWIVSIFYYLLFAISYLMSIGVELAHHYHKEIKEL